MLVLKDIVKDYSAGELKVRALKKINIAFRKNEFVAVLGPSGCGKTTMLNIIGGLDQYTSGDLKICGKSTKEFKDRDWDAYRNNSIGFVFQSYNLITHQSVLANVELALTLSGVSKAERREKAIEALTKVGLKDQINKKPNMLSGGQMQRVAIARALVNDPEIILADEPTGALDTETSVQIMELLKEIAKDKLIIMVTHNPELADNYASRIVRLLDGEIIDDTNAYSLEEEKKENEEKSADFKRTSMKFATALNLSFNNLLTKKARTFMTAFAGSIGIIGIALILSLSNGVQEYIDRVQEETLSSYPLTIESETVNVSTFFQTMTGNDVYREEHELDKVYSNNVMSQLLNTILSEVKTNDLKSFKEFAENDETIQEAVNDIQYVYSPTLNIYKADTEKDVTKVNPCDIFNELPMMQQMQSDSSMQVMQSMNTQGMDVWGELIDNSELVEAQYDIVEGKWPEKFNEVVLIVDENNEVSDYTMYALGLKDQSEVPDIMEKIMSGENFKSEIVSYSYQEIFDTKFKLVLAPDFYQYNELTGKYEDKRTDDDYMKEVIANGTEISIVGIVRPNEEAIATSANKAIGYLSSLTEYAIEQTKEAEIVKKQLDNPTIDVFTGIEFATDEEEKTFTMDDVNNYVATLPTEEQQNMQTLMSTMTEEQIIAMFAESMKPEETEATYDTNMILLGFADLSEPMMINIYAKDFESKDKIADAIEAYNKKALDAGEDEKEITYTDYVALMMSSVSKVINAISYILIAFVSISLVVSSIMIGIITYISVLERTKEIGILRSIGASKKDVSSVFNAETIIVGFVAGLIGIIVTVLLNIPINIVIKHITDISSLSRLPVAGGVLLVLISMFLTFIAGLIPSRVASKKDPVVALRSE